MPPRRLAAYRMTHCSPPQLYATSLAVDNQSEKVNDRLLSTFSCSFPLFLPSPFFPSLLSFQAKQYFEKAHRMDPYHLDTVYQLADLYLAEDNLDKGISL